MEAELKWLDDPTVFRVNQIPAHSDHQAFASEAEAAGAASSLVQSLDGKWQFIFAATPNERPANFWAPAFEGPFDEITVPSEIELSDYAQIHYINTWYPWEGQIYRRPAGTGDNPQALDDFSTAADNSVGIYRRTFDLAAGLQGKNVRIRFEGAERALYVWLNGHFVGYAEDSFTPSEFDLTPYLQPTGNVLVVEVFKHSSASWLEDQDMFRFSGLFRSVSLLAQPAIHVEDLHILPTVNDDFTSGQLTLKLKLTAKEAGYLTVDVQDASQTSLLHQRLTSAATVELAPVTFEQVHLWDTDDPYLYHLVIKVYSAAGALLEVVPYDFGFRRIEINADHVIMLNNHRLIINGVNRHEWNAKTGRTITLADMHQDIATFKENNINAVRTCHYPDRLEWYQLCDQNGIYMMAENNLETHGTWQKSGAVEPSYNVPGSVELWLPAVLDRARTNFETFKNHPAILFWSLGNESYAGDDIAAMDQYYHDHDSSRLTHYEGVIRNPAYRDRISDVESWMYLPPAGVEEYLQTADKPFLECEYMHSMGNSVGGMGSYIRLMQKYPQYAGGFIWDFIDQALLVTDPVTGQEVMRYGGDFDDRHADYEFSGDGIMFADRTPKPAMQEVKYYYGLPK